VPVVYVGGMVVKVGGGVVYVAVVMHRQYRSIMTVAVVVFNGGVLV